MNYALHRLAEKMAPELGRYGIECRPADDLVIYRDVARKLPPYADTRVCRRILNDYIKDAKKRLADEAKDNQVDMLGEI